MIKGKKTQTKNDMKEREIYHIKNSSFYESSKKFIIETASLLFKVKKISSCYFRSEPPHQQHLPVICPQSPSRQEFPSPSRWCRRPGPAWPPCSRGRWRRCDAPSSSRWTLARSDRGYREEGYGGLQWRISEKHWNSYLQFVTVNLTSHFLLTASKKPTCLKSGGHKYLENNDLKCSHIK